MFVGTFKWVTHESSQNFVEVSGCFKAVTNHLKLQLNFHCALCKNCQQGLLDDNCMLAVI